MIKYKMKNEEHKDSELIKKNVKMFLWRFSTYLSYCQFGLIRNKEIEEMIELKKNTKQKNDQDLCTTFIRGNNCQNSDQKGGQIQIFRVFFIMFVYTVHFISKRDSFPLWKYRYNSCWSFNEFLGHFMVFVRSFCVFLVRNSFADVVSH